MKKILSITFCLFFAMGMMAQQKTVQIEAGGLNAALGFQKMTVTSLKIIGEINGSDIVTIHEMASGNGQLQNLDLSEAVIVKGGARYATGRNQDCYTRKNDVSTRLFAGCNKLQTIVIPNRARLISYDAFSNCPNLREINTDSNLKFQSVEGILYTADMKTVMRCPEGLILDEVEIVEGVEQIYTGAFLNIRLLNTVTLPASIKGVSNMSFQGCPLTTIIMKGERAPAMENAFDANVVNSATLYIPSGARESYLSADSWGKFRNMVER